MSKCQCCSNPFGVCHNNYKCACHPRPWSPPPRDKPEKISTDQVRDLMKAGPR